MTEPNLHFDILADGYSGLARRTRIHGPLVQAVRDAMASTPPDRPFKVFLLCNFVYHRRPGETQQTYDAKTTHPSVVRLALRAIDEAASSRPVEVSIGNSPLQSALWDQIVADSRLADLVADFDDRRPGFRVRLRDLRMNVQPRDLEAIDHQRYAAESAEDVVALDLGRDSLLDQLAGNQEYRVLDYPTERIRRMHAPGRHVYLIHRDVLASDLIVSIPKLKTHEKVGMTAVIKGCVGTVAHKDCLAHHRVGAAPQGGDEYPQPSRARALQTSLHHRLYGMKLTRWTWLLRQADRAWRKLFQLQGDVASGSWRGNDTAWRMSIDLARITLFGTVEGRMSERPCRRHFALTDGIVAGEGQGPLDPTPVAFGWLAFSTNPAVADLANALVMGFAADELPIVREAFAPHRWPLAEPGAALRADGPEQRVVDGPALAAAWSRRFALPRGW